MEYDLIVVGAGPAGLFCAINASMAGMRVRVLEKNPSAGRKLLASGSGRCNLTNAANADEFPLHYGSAFRFVKPALLGFSNQDLMSYFSDHGVPLVEMNEGKIFPASQSSRDILKVILDEAARLNVELSYTCRADSIAREGDAFLALIREEELRAPNLLLSTGGRSYPGTGSTGDGYRFATELGHSIAETAPALTSLAIKEYALAECAGVSLKDAEFRIVREGKEVARGRGDVLFTHKGLSGPGILDSSRLVRPGDEILLRLTGAMTDEEIESAILAASAKTGSRTVKTVVCSLGMPERLVLAALSISGVDGSMTMAKLDRESRKRLLRAFSAMPFRVAALGGYEEAMATRGGIALSEVNSKTMESKIVPGLFFAGEILDVDGDTGGFNLQFAFSSGKLAAQAMVRARDAAAQGRNA
jgi:predicted Rossmann fold flavoprotein